MIALVGAGRGGDDDGEATVYTVPWSPSITERPGAQIPGHAYAFMMKFVRAMIAAGSADRMGDLTDDDFAEAALQTGKLTAAIITRLARDLAAELQIVPQRRREQG